MQHPLIRATLLSLALAAAIGAGIPSAAAASKKPAVAVVEAPIQEKVVYHINDASLARIALRNVENHLSASADAKIVVVTHGKGIDFLLNDAKDKDGNGYQAQIAGLKEKGVEFRVCRNTLKGRNLTDEAVIMEAQVVPSGVAEIGRLQARESFVYLKP